MIIVKSKSMLSDYQKSKLKAEVEQGLKDGYLVIDKGLTVQEVTSIITVKLDVPLMDDCPDE